MSDERSYDAADTVRAMTGTDWTTAAIDDAARRCGWPKVSPHPFLVAELLDSDGTTEGRVNARSGGEEQ